MTDYGETAGEASVRFRRRLPGPIERVWEYLTDPELRSTWFAAGDMELRKGGRLHYVFQHSTYAPPGEVTPEKYRKEEGYSFVGTVTRCEPPRVIAWTWDGSEVIVELEPAGDDVQLTLTHVRLASRKEVVDVSAGWHVHLDLLRERLHGRAPVRFWSDVERYDREYDLRVPPARS